MSEAKLPSADVIRQLLHYDPKTGKLWWRFRGREWFKSDRSFRTWNMCYAETEAFTCYDASGYRQGNLFNARTKAHRLIWAWVNGEWPKGDVDHINGVRDDNRIENLRDVTRAENLRNVRRRGDNTSGHVGVSLLPKTKRWRVRVGSVEIGSFATLEEAVQARKAAAAAHGFHQNHGRSAA